MYQVYDSFIFDIHPSELDIIEQIKNLLEKNGKYNFDIQYNLGNNLKECTKTDIETESELIN